MTNTNLLKSKMVEKGYTIKVIANELGITSTSYFNKMHNTSEFKASEIANLCKILQIGVDDAQTIFFSEECE